jgi:hypothetical protein
VLHAEDSFLKYLEGKLTSQGIAIGANPQGKLVVGGLMVTFLQNSPMIKTNPSVENMLVSLDVYAEEAGGSTARRAAKKIAMAVNDALSTFSIPKKDWTDPAHPKELGTSMQPDFWGSWRRIPDPDIRFEHLSRTLTVRYTAETRAQN